MCELQRFACERAEAWRCQSSLGQCRRPRCSIAFVLHRIAPPLFPCGSGGDAVYRVGAHALRGDVGLRHAQRQFAGFDIVDGFDQQASVGHDGGVAGAQVFARAVLDGAHAFAGPLVVHIDVFFTHAEVGAVGLFFGVVAPVVVAA